MHVEVRGSAPVTHRAGQMQAQTPTPCTPPLLQIAPRPIPRTHLANTVLELLLRMCRVWPIPRRSHNAVEEALDRIESSQISARSSSRSGGSARHAQHVCHRNGRHLVAENQYAGVGVCTG